MYKKDSPKLTREQRLEIIYDLEQAFFRVVDFGPLGISISVVGLSVALFKTEIFDIMNLDVVTMQHITGVDEEDKIDILWVEI